MKFFFLTISVSGCACAGSCKCAPGDCDGKACPSECCNPPCGGKHTQLIFKF